MKIVVFVKYVPDAQAERTFADDHTTDRDVDGLLSELDEYPLEEALKLTEDGDGEVVALTVGPEDAVDAVKRALQMGADSGVHVLDDDLHGSDATVTSLVLAKAVEEIGDVDLVLTGIASTDAGTSIVPVQVATRLGWPALTFASALDIADGTATVRRDGDTSSATVTAALPAVVSVTDQINEPRYPSFKGIMAAKKKKVEELELDDLDLDADAVGTAGSWTETTDTTARPPRAAGKIVEDDGTGADQLVAFLAEQKLL